MKRHFTYLIISLIVVLFGVAFFMGILKKKTEKSLLERIPTSKSHLHMSPDGKTIEHTHRQITPPVAKPKSANTDPATTKHPVLRAWENLDLEAIKRDYQPYTVSEIIEKWDEGFMEWENPSKERIAKWEAYMPKEKWLQHLMEHGYPFIRPVNYTLAFAALGKVLMAKDDFDNSETRTRILQGCGMSANASWEELEEVVFKWELVASINVQRAKDVDPSVAGGVTDLSGVFTPFSPNKVYVHISEDKQFSSFTGVMLSKEQKDDLAIYGVAPKGVTVVYTDENGIPLPADVKPRFYERQMAALEVIEEHIEQMITEHDALFKTLPKPYEKTVPKEKSTSSLPLHPDDTHIDDGSDLREPVDRPNISIDRNNIPLEMLPSEPPSRANIQEWFEVLQELHGGELPKDLHVLKEVISELDAIRQVGKQKSSKQSASPAQRPPDRVEPSPK